MQVLAYCRLAIAICRVAIVRKHCRLGCGMRRERALSRCGRTRCLWRRIGWGGNRCALRQREVDRSKRQRLVFAARHDGCCGGAGLGRGLGWWRLGELAQDQLTAVGFVIVIEDQSQKPQAGGSSGGAREGSGRIDE
jgi:hypothetical protein